MTPMDFDRRKLRTNALESRLTPIEIAKIIEDGDDDVLPFFLRPLLAAGETPVSYVRESWNGAFNYYTAHRGARRLIISFNEPGVPTSFFLQMLRDDLYDLVVLHDPRRLHFDRGIPGFSNSFLETVRLIEGLVKAKGFDEVITLGVSMGGYPALRAGLLLGADRAISIGGRYCWHVGRLLRKKHTAEAFDVLCPCFSHRETQMLAITAAYNRQDVKDLEALRCTFPRCQVLLLDTKQHNVVAYFHSASLLRLFCACLFEYWDNEMRNDLLVLLNKTARYSHEVQTGRSRYEEELAMIYESSSWRLTEPLRRIGQVLARWKRRPSAP